jgi:D-alanyl-lipoteichoic acid acyltransferase DltB (MBOAT superfamily)
MLFNSYDYLVYVLPVSALGYFALGSRPRWSVRWLVVASLVFYGWWNPRYLPLILASIAFNFVVALCIARARSARPWVFAGVAGNLLLLGVYKYSDFVLRTLAGAGLVPLVQFHLALPLGISFFTFTLIACLADVARGKAREATLSNYALFVTFFPHLLAGPIIHHAEMMPQFASASNKRVAWDNVGRGLFLLAIGLAKKTFIADPLAPLVASGFDHATAIGAVDAWLSVLAYALQIYFDFSGYTDMALGAALLFNIRLPINFDSPYQALDLRDFWHRWHITLSRFLREYLYIPLGGNRRAEPRVLANLFVTFLLGGLWHGAAWTFVAWGALHGAGLCCVRLWKRLGRPLPRLVAWAITFLFVLIAWVFFRAASLPDALAMLRAMAGFGRATPAANGFAVSMQGMVAAAIALVAGLFIVALPRNSNELTRDVSASWLAGVATTAALVASILQFSHVAPFLYFNF